jgi:DNA helicase-2/ATP-dependent DNA helicase PcrA
MTAIALTAEQQAVADIREGAHLVAAGPGSGKTRVLVERILALVADGCDPRRILTVSFTKAAALELQERLQGTAAEAAECRTWHAWGFRLLRSVGVAKKLVQPRWLCRQIWIDRRESEDPTEDWTPEVLADQIGAAKIAGHREAPADWSPQRAGIFTEYQSRLRNAEWCDYTDMLLEARAVLERDAAVLRRMQSRYSHIQVDECQDNNILQWQLLRLLAPGAQSVLLVGDHRQSIYRFAGARPEELVAYAKGVQVHSITLNWRSTTPIVEACNALISHAPEEHQLGAPFRARPDAPGAPVTIDAASPEEVAGQIACAIEGGYALREISVLYRIRRYSVPVSRALYREGIPHVIRGGGCLFDAPHMRVLVDWLRVGAQTGKWWSEALPNVIHKPKRYLANTFKSHCERLSWDLDEISDAVRSDPAARKFRARWESLMEDVDYLQQPGLDAEQILHRALGLTSYGRQPTTLRDQLAGQCPDDEDGSAAEDWAQLLALAAEYSDPAEAIAEIDRLRGTATIDPGDEEPDAVVLQTIHRSKGTEYDVVHVVGVDEDVLPHAKTLQEDLENQTEEGLHEERRCLFVAASRARDMLYLHHGAVASRFLAELAPDYCTHNQE